MLQCSHSVPVYLVLHALLSIQKEPTTTQTTLKQQQHQTMSSQPGGPYTHVQFETSVGTFCVELYYQHAPRTCHNIAALAATGYYNGTVFHRIIRDFMIQGGDPSGTGRGGESIYGGKFDDEISKNLKHTGAGVVSMANAGPNTNGSQFFVSLKPLPFLDGKHTIFGRIYSGKLIWHVRPNVQSSTSFRGHATCKI